jgi:hypothetical protein
MARRRPDAASGRSAGSGSAAASSRAVGPSARVDRLLGGAGGAALLGLAFAVLALIVYAPSFRGPFVSDDLHYVATNPFVHELSWAHVRDILDPTGSAAVFVVNYAPVQLLIHTLEWQVFGADPAGFHVVNVLLHALGAALLVRVFARAGMPGLVALFCGLVFLLHPANVEAVAWISQLKSPASFVLAMGALLAHPRRPALGAALFGLALLAKPTAAAVLPVAAILDWTRDGRVRVGWLGLWAVVLAGFGVAEFWTHQRSGAAEPIDADPFVRLRTSLAIAARYVWISATSLGVSTFHEPEPVRRWSDPTWLAGLGLAIAMAARGVVTLFRRRPEAAFWALAGASFLPVSQLFPFLYPMADRYLYFILPGLLGGVGLLACDLLGPRLASLGADRRRMAGTVAAGAAAALLVAFGVHASERARIWASPAAILADSAVHYPQGRTALLLRARRAAQVGDSDTALADLRLAWERGFHRYDQLQDDPAFASLQDAVRFQALVRQMAGWWVEHLGSLDDPTQIELHTLALAQLARGDRDAAIATLERAQRRGGPIDEQVRADLAMLRGGG